MLVEPAQMEFELDGSGEIIKATPTALMSSMTFHIGYGVVGWNAWLLCIVINA